MNAASHESQIVAQLTQIQVPLRLYVQSLLPGDSSASDVSQITNAKIWEKRAEFTLGTHFKAWAFSIARFEVLNYRKQQARDSRLVFGHELEETFAEELAEENDLLERRHLALKQCLGKLRSSDRELLMHRYASTETLLGYAQKSGRSIGGLKVTLHRLRNALLSCIEKHVGPELLES